MLTRNEFETQAYAYSNEAQVFYGGFKTTLTRRDQGPMYPFVTGKEMSLTQSTRVHDTAWMVYEFITKRELVSEHGTKTWVGSYELKHVLESHPDLREHVGGYVSNGQAILACIVADYEWRRVAFSPNAQVKLDVKAYRILKRVAGFLY